MLEWIWSRVKVTCLLVLFLSPIGVQFWSKSLDVWFKQNQSYPAEQNIVNAGRIP